jgi:flavin reductase (DIM6/NTAB) family NADH-FMN oxidoreductase RutF
MTVRGLPRYGQGQHALGGRAGQAAGGPLRTVLGHFATGVTVLAAGADAPQGMTANSFTSVSLSPPLVLVCVNRAAAIHQTVLDSGSFAVSVLAGPQEHVARHFADHSRPRGRREFDIAGWSPAPNTGAPVINGALAWIECELAATYDGGDHSIFLGAVLASGHEPTRDALLFFGGRFHRPALRRAGKWDIAVYQEVS